MQNLFDTFPTGFRSVASATGKFDGRVSYSLLFGLTDLLSAIDSGDLAGIGEALKNVDDINAGQGGGTALMLSAYNGNLDAVRLLLDSGADPNIQESVQNMTALMLAASEGHKDVAEFLLQRRADPNMTNSYGANALMFAASKDSYELAESLVKQGTVVTNAAGSQILEYAEEDIFQQGDELARLMRERRATLP
jgi:ankyrin repeat protein